MILRVKNQIYELFFNYRTHSITFNYNLKLLLFRLNWALGGTFRSHPWLHMTKRFKEQKPQINIKYYQY